MHLSVHDRYHPFLNAHARIANVECNCKFHISWSLLDMNVAPWDL